MEINKKIDSLNTYDLITKFLQRPGITSHISKHLSSATMKPVDGVFSSVINDSFIILKFQESPKSSQYFKYLAYSNTFDRLDISSSKNIIDCGYNNTSFYYILSIGNTFSIITPENEINYETLILKDSIKLSNEIGKKYIIKISCGENHCLFLTHAGMIYTMGDNTYGQLGLGENHITKENKEGILLKDLLNYRINDICAGKNHSFCFGVVRELTKAGNAGPNNNIEFDPKRPYYLFGWGDNSFNQLGMKQINQFNAILRPTKICCNNNLNNPAIIGEELINISCGLNFSSLLFRNGKLLTFGDNQYNQLIFKENEIMPNFVHNYIPKKIGKIINVIIGGNSLMLMTEFNKLIIFGKYNEPNLDQVTIVDLINNCDNNKYIFNDNILKLIVFNNETPNINIIKNITNVKIDEFLVNVTKKENQKNENIDKINNKNNEIINNKTNENIVNKNNELNMKNNIQKNKTQMNKEINNRTLDINSSKKHLKLNSNVGNNAALRNNGEIKSTQIKNLNLKKNKTIKYKNSFTKISHTTNDKVIVTNNLFHKKENKNQYNGAEKKSENLKHMKTYESNGKSSNTQSSEDLKLNNEDNIIQKEKEIINGNDIKENQNGNKNQNNLDINNIEIDNKTFLNKNILQNKIPISQNRYEDNYESFNILDNDKDLNIKENNKKIEENKNNGGNMKNGKNNEIKQNLNILNNFEKEEKNNKNKPSIEIIKNKSNIKLDNNENKNIEIQEKELNKNNKIDKNVKKNNIIETNTTNKNPMNNDNIVKNNIRNGDNTENQNIKKNIDNNVSNNTQNINNFQNKNKENNNQTNKLLQNIDNNSLIMNNNNNVKTKNQEKKNIDIINKENNNNKNNGINTKININNKESNNKILNQTKKDNILTSTKKENTNFNDIRNINKENNQNKINKNNKVLGKENKKTDYLPIKIENIEKKEETTINNLDKKENTNIFRELGQFVSSTMNKINKYTKNRTDIKKDAFFENIISGNFASKLNNINPKILLNNIISGVPNRYRGRFWLKCIGNQLSITPDYFDINLSKFYEKYEDTKESKYKLPFPYLGIFKENTPLTLDLCEVINGFVISRPDIKYNEKISYLVGMLIINMDKYQAYVSFMNLILNPNIIIYYLSNDKDEPVMEYGYSNTPTGDEDTNINKNKKIPSIVEKNLRRVIFKQLLFHNLPELCSNLELLNVLPEDYFDEWNQTIFSKNFNVDISMKIWDLFVVQGEKIIFDAGIALMKELEEELNNCEEKEEALDILLNSQMREINENNIMNNMQKVEYPDWIQSEVLNMTEDTIIPINFNKK